jgi:hypothetical protein
MDTVMTVIGGRLADEVDVDVTGGLAAGQRLPLKVGAEVLDAVVLTVGRPVNGRGQVVDTCVVANLLLDGEKFSALLRWGDTYLSRWTLLIGHTAGVADRAAA